MKTPRVALLGNMNNNFFCYTRYLRDRGIEAELLLPYDREYARRAGYDHFHPSMDTFGDGFSDFTRELDWVKRGMTDPDIARVVRRDLAGFDALIGHGWAPAFVDKAGLRLRIFSPFGSDLYEYPWGARTLGWKERMALRLRHGPAHPPLRDYWICRHQRRGIERASYVLMQNRRLTDVLARFQMEGEQVWAMIPFLYAPEYTADRLPAAYERSAIYPALHALRETHDLLLFHHSRHVWRTKLDDFSWKGNDQLVRGFAAFVHARRDVRACLVMLEYGPDVEATKQLVTELGIADSVRWFSTMPRKEIMVAISLSDMVCTEFAMAWAAGGAFFEALVMGKPMMHNRDEAIIRASCDEPYPSVGARTPEEICRTLGDLADCPEKYRSIGTAGQAWFQRHVVDRGVGTLVHLIEGAAR